MNEAYQTVITAGDEERRDLFLGTAARLGTAVQNVEKDFWVCWTLDALFNGLEPGGPRLLFKGGTSLSKAFGLISRFSEDIDITVFREDLCQYVDVAELEAMSGKKRRARLDEIRDACRTYIDGPFFSQLQARHARLFFGSPDLGLETAKAGSFTLLPAPAMMDALQRDYDAMTGMIFGPIPTLDEVLASVRKAQAAVDA
ncbi:nucleotidyl transferase AbiEii/AbiGii toxin family protein [Variovorax sp. 350MFTsu5.1]|uniref:nucleotidyl transferase AbiEii/AbiGii toxin family protein n=1 Tax=Variovorax sp. 350MFTsu5.1 TaxID=3158365 RepID=UPI003AAEB536